MIRLDKMVILCPYNEETMNIGQFGTVKVKDDEVVRSVFPIESKYSNEASISFSKAGYNQIKPKTHDHKGDLKIEINSSILQSRYLEKITESNLEHCLSSVLNRAGVNVFDPKEVIRNGRASLVHVTEDLNMSISKDEYKAISSTLRQPRKWEQHDNSRNGYAWKSKQKGAQDKGILAMYDKGGQMMGLEQRRKFMEECSIPAESFEGKLRLELKLTSPVMIRKGFGIENNHVLTVLQADQNPIVNFIENAFDLSDKQKHWYSMDKLSNLERLAFMEKLKYDWNEIEREIRRVSKTNASKTIANYRKLYQAVVEDPDSCSSGVKLLSTMIELIDGGGVLQPMKGESPYRQQAA